MSRKPSFTLIAELDAPGSGGWQGAVQDIKTGEYYFAHAPGSGGAKLHRFAKFDGIAKPYLDTMFCDGAAHVYGFGVHDNEVWIGWDGSDGNDIVRLPYKATVDTPATGRVKELSATAKKSVTEKLHVFTENPAQPSFSVTRTRVVIMEILDNQYRFTKRRTSDILANKNLPLGKVITLPKPSNTWLQGFTLGGEFLYVGYGKPAEKAWIDKYSFETGKKIGSLDVSASGFLKGESTVDGDRELEGLDGHTFSVKVFHDDKRKIRVYKINNF